MPAFRSRNLLGVLSFLQRYAAGTTLAVLMLLVNIGLEMAEGLAEAGASLMLCARRDEWLTPTVDAFRARGFTVEGMLCDVSKAADVQAVVDKEQNPDKKQKAQEELNAAKTSAGAQDEVTCKAHVDKARDHVKK